MISQHSLPFGDEVYNVRRAVDRETKRGFVTISDGAGRAVLVFSARYPNIQQLIVGWRAGYTRGLERGRREVSQENVS
jgi:hypothetical protein